MSESDNLVTVLEVVLGLKRGERVLLVSDAPKARLGTVFAGAAETIGAQVVRYELDEESRPLTEVPGGLTELLDFPDVCLNVFDARAEETPFRVQLLKAQMTGGARVGHAPGITDDMLGTGALTADYRKMQAEATRLLSALEGARTARVTSEGGSDITLNIEGRGFLTDVAVAAGEAGNLPAGEVYCAPVEDGADGVIVADASVGGLPLGPDPVTLRVAGGRLERVTCDDADLLARLEALLEVDDEARVVGELGIGLNPRARITNNMLEGEKAGGTVHIAFGDNDGMPGGQNRSQTHRDFLMKRATIEVTYTDGTTRTLVRDGQVSKD
jgi:leucyl aminopeptidase (aminopeptidase T)